MSLDPKDAVAVAVVPARRRVDLGTSLASGVASTAGAGVGRPLGTPTTGCTGKETQRLGLGPRTRTSGAAMRRRWR
jgi:hypothetical protein